MSKKLIVVGIIPIKGKPERIKKIVNTSLLKLKLNVLKKVK